MIPNEIPHHSTYTHMHKECDYVQVSEWETAKVLSRVAKRNIVGGM